MHHEILKAFDRTVTPAEAVSRWESDSQTLTPVREGANLVYQFSLNARPTYLRLTHASHRSRGEVDAEIEFVRYLKSSGCSVAAPVPSKANLWVEQVDSCAGPFLVSVFEEAPGERLQWGRDADNRRTLSLMGEALGKLHALSRQYPSSDRFYWHQDRLLFDLPRNLPEFEAPVKREAQDVFRFLESLLTTPDHFGLIHGDFIPSNIRRQGDTFTAFDFDDCCYHWYVYDIAIFMWSAAQLSAERRRSYLQVFLGGYAKRFALPDDAPQQINWFRRLSNVARYFHSLRNWDLVNLSPELLEELESRRNAILNPIDFT